MFMHGDWASKLAMVAVLAVGLVGPCTAGGVLVTNGNDSGAGSFRAALSEAAKSDAPATILVTTHAIITSNSSLIYQGKAPLAIYGRGQTVSSDADATLLIVSAGANLAVRDVNFRGRGGFSINNQGSGKGIFVAVPKERTGTVQLSLDKVTVSGVAYHGIHVSDCDLGDKCGAGRGGGGDGSPASVAVQISNSEISDVGNGHFDADGLRVDERGPGDIRFDARDSKFVEVGADGIELDEGGAGSVFVTVVDSRIDDNGGYCDAKVLKPFLPRVLRASFEDGKVREADIPGEIKGSADDACLEREVQFYKSGFVKSYKFSIDFDDGFDVDEAGPGDLWALIVGTSIRRNLDEGIDFGEEDDGSANIVVWQSIAKGNGDEGFKVIESGPGNVAAQFHDVVARNNGGKGAELAQRDQGNINVLVDRVRTADNDKGKKSGLEVVQKGDGNGALTIRNSKISDGIDAVNVKVIQE